MPEAGWLTLGVCCNLVGAACLALAFETHWQQVLATNAPLARARSLRLRLRGAVAVLASLLVLCRADQASMAVLVWFMSFTTACLVVAFTLAWRPRGLAWLARLLR